MWVDVNLDISAASSPPVIIYRTHILSKMDKLQTSSKILLWFHHAGCMIITLKEDKISIQFSTSIYMHIIFDWLRSTRFYNTRLEMLIKL